MRRLIGCIILFAMTIHMGILCDGCGTVHFIATSPGVELVTKIGGPYKVTCKPFGELTPFPGEVCPS